MIYEMRPEDKHPAGGAASEGDTSAHSFSAPRMGDLQPIIPHQGPPAWGAAQGGDLFHSVTPKRRGSAESPDIHSSTPPARYSFHLSPQPVENQLGAHHPLALRKVSEHPFTPPQIISKITVRVQRRKGQMPEWETEWVTPGMAGADGLLLVERGDVTTRFSPEEAAAIRLLPTPAPPRGMDSVTLRAFLFSAILESRRRGDQTGQVQGCKKLCPNCRGRMWPTFLGLFANVAQRRGVRTAMLAERAHIRSPVLPSRHRYFWCILPTQMDMHFTLQGEKDPTLQTLIRVGSLIGYCPLQQNSAFPELRKLSMDKFPWYVFFRF